ncbi:MAG: lipoyl synthase [Acidobacteria bacterium]|nr:lipoyl synthase [Acidobacteriota bacterium]
MSQLQRRHPDWLKVRMPSGDTHRNLKVLVAGLNLHTVCEEAHCPNLGECWGRGVATFMILGDICTRGCRYCAVRKGRPAGLDLDEPRRVAAAVQSMGVHHAVITSVDRDELPDGGAFVFAMTIHEIRRACPDCSVEVLIPDFRGSEAALRTVVEARPDILNHNIETVPRLFRKARLGGRYDWSIQLLGRAKRLDPALPTKTGMMLGLGETREEVLEVMRELVRVQVDILTLGQYLQPTKGHLPVERYYHPDEFAELKRIGERIGFHVVEAGPLVRSSYHADQQVIHLRGASGFPDSSGA